MKKVKFGALPWHWIRKHPGEMQRSGLPLQRIKNERGNWQLEFMLEKLFIRPKILTGKSETDLTDL